MEKSNEMRTRSEIINEITETQSVFDRLAMKIGLLYSNYQLTNDSKQIEIINTKVNAFQIVESRIRLLEEELIKSEE